MANNKDNQEEASRQYFLTVFESAECWPQLEKILEAQSNCSYAYILHDADIEGTGEQKRKHFHIVLIYKNARDFSTIQNHFPGAHIEKVQVLAKSVQYLTHKNNKEKHQYSYDSIITNNKEDINSLYLQKDYPILNEEVIIDEISKAYSSGRVLSVVYFYMTYGNKQTKEFRQMIIDLLNNIKATINCVLGDTDF